MAFMYPSQSAILFEHRKQMHPKTNPSTQTQNLPQIIPHGVLVPNNSYLELFSEDDLQMRIGQASVLEFPKANEFNLINGSLFGIKKETSMRISQNRFS